MATDCVVKLYKCSYANPYIT